MNLDSLIRDGIHNIDYQPVMEDKRRKNVCPEGYMVRHLNPTDKYGDRFNLTENTLVILSTGKAYKTHEFCVEPNSIAKSKYEHFADICVEAPAK